MKKTFRSNLIVLALLISPMGVTQAESMPAPVESLEQAEAVLEQRSEFMKKYGAAMKAFGNYLKRGEGQPQDLADRASHIAQTAHEIPGLFPPDTGMDRLKDSESMSNIWQDWKNFVAAAQATVEPAQDLQAAFNGADKAAIAKAFKALGKQSCRNCHHEYREHEH